MSLFAFFQKKVTTSKSKAPEIDPINRNFVCIPFDPINSMNDLRIGDWNMDKVHESFKRGLLRYAKQSEVDKAYEVGRLQEKE